MSDNVVITMVGLVYAASSGGLFYVTKNFLPSDDSMKQMVNFPLARIKEGNVSDILELFRNLIESVSIPARGSVKVYENHRDIVERFYRNMMERLSQKAMLMKCHKRLRFTKVLSVFNIMLSVFVLLYIVLSLVRGGWESGGSLEAILQARIMLFVTIFLVPWAVFVVIYLLCRKYETCLSAAQMEGGG